LLCPRVAESETRIKSGTIGAMRIELDHLKETFAI
jgi:hypothetical protein